LLIYLVGHAFTKGGLFLTSGILLHRLRAIGERSLFTKGKALPWTATLWFLGAVGLAAAPPFLLMVGEAGISQAAEQFGRSWISWIGVIGGVADIHGGFTGWDAYFLGMGYRADYR
jgi:formate hydrogenlyase subunit 3/multisubunit Na+/H+ antiporter MnhD subunit